MYGNAATTDELLGTLSLVSAAGGQIVTTTEAKLHCRVDVTDDDTYIANLIQAAQDYCEREIYGHRQFLPATYDLLVRDWFESLPLPRPPLASVVSVKYYDTNGSQQTLATTYYNVAYPWRQPGYIERAPDQSWPSLQGDRPFPITIRFLAGYPSPVTVDATTNLFTSTGRAFNDNQRVRFWNSGGTLPAGVSAGTDYYIRDASGQTFKVTTIPASTAVDVTDTGTGLHYCGDFPFVLKQAMLVLIEHWYRNRAAVHTGASKEIEASLRAILENEGWGSYS